MKNYFRSPLLFYLGCLEITIGFSLHIPMFLMGSENHYVLVGMPMTPEMYFGMFLIVVGMVSAMWGLIPKQLHNIDKNHVKVPDNIPFSIFHLQLIIVLIFALTIDVMKPYTLAFVLPGMRKEYGLAQSEAAFLPLFAFLGMVIGSFVWGKLGDQIGRRATILFSGLMFMGTAVCGAMPAFSWNVGMCFLMGISSAGMIPVTVALLAEVIPKRYRSSMLVLVIGVGTVLGYLVTSAAAAILEPTYGWRILWLIGLPSGVLMILLNHYIPESPKFLVSRGLKNEANQVLKEFGSKLIETNEIITPSLPPDQQEQSKGLFSKKYFSSTLVVILCGLAGGLVSFCFLLWLPTNLRMAGYGVGFSDMILAKSALVAFPGILLVAWFATRYDSKKTLILFTLLTIISLLGFIGLEKYGVLEHPNILNTLVVLLLIGSTGMAIILLPYATEIYPTKIRSFGTGIVASAGKLGGLLGIGVALLDITPTLALSAALVSVPLLLSIAFLSFLTLKSD